MVLQSLAGLPAFLGYFCMAAVIVLLYLWIYTLITPATNFRLSVTMCRAPAISLGLTGAAAELCRPVSVLGSWTVAGEPCGLSIR